MVKIISRLITRINSNLVNKILSPYKSKCRYLINPVIITYRAQDYHILEVPSEIIKDKNVIEASARFRILKSFYIKNTGHINSVEINLCYNMLAYCLLAECIRRKLLIKYLNWNVDKLLTNQLTNVLIADFSCTFKKPIISREFNGLIELYEVLRKNKIVFFKTKFRFDDDSNGLSVGKCTFAIKDE